MGAKSFYLIVEGILGITLFGFIHISLAIAFVCGMLLGGVIVYLVTKAKGKKVELEPASKE